MKDAHEEFKYLRDNIKHVASLLINDKDYIQASFMLGNLHAICHENVRHFEPKEEKQL